MRKGLLFIISGPAGSGKGTVVKCLMNKHPELRLSISATTRQPRPGEMHGVNYYYISEEEFDERIANNNMLEYNTYKTGKRYGTPRKEVLETLEAGNDIILEIDTNGAMQVKSAMEDAVAIMLTPPSYELLEARLRGRNSGEPEEEILDRLALSKEEIQFLPRYDYAVLNEENQAEACADLIYTIIQAEHQRAKHNLSIMKKFM